MPTTNALNYDRLKLAILDCYEVSEETHRARFWSLQYKAGDRPWSLVMEFKEAATCCLNPPSTESVFSSTRSS